MGTSIMEMIRVISTNILSINLVGIFLMLLLYDFF